MLSQPRDRSSIGDARRSQRELLEEFAKASGEDVNHPLSKGFVDKLKEMFG
jgi:hypothetical protein